MPPAALLGGYTAREAAQLTGVSLARLRGLLRDGVLTPQRGPRGEYVFGVRDLALLRTARGLAQAVPPRRLRRALRTLRRRLDRESPLTGVRLSTLGDDLVVREGARLWRPVSGQGVLDFHQEAAASVATLARPPARRQGTRTAEDWYTRGAEAEETDPEGARDAYRRALELDPDHPGACVNLGRLLHESGETEAAARHYRRALRQQPQDAVAAFNLGVALEDLGHTSEAVEAYEAALRADPGCAEAHYNLSWIYERTGQRALAFRHLRAYRKLTRD